MILIRTARRRRGLPDNLSGRPFFNQTEENFIFLIFLKTDGTNSPRFLFVNTEGNDGGITRKSR